VFDLQGHRGARGLKPENTLPSVEAALDLQVTTIEVDLHLTKDGVPVLSHDEALRPGLVRALPEKKVPPPTEEPRIRTLDLEQLRGYAADQNPEPKRFAMQDPKATPTASAFSKSLGLETYRLPTLAELFAFVAAYAGDLGKQAGKTEAQRKKAAKVRFNLEFKRVPFRPEFVGDAFDGEKPAEFERMVVAEIRKAAVADRTIIQSFDHRVVRAARVLETRLTGAVLIEGTAPINPVRLVREATAQVYSPDFLFLDERQVRQAHEGQVRVIPWTVNETADLNRLLDWKVDGIITDYPDRLVPLLQARHIDF
jgi:glycerophosphoryl diester phosphodiesterase